MAARQSLSQQQWVAINYALMLVSLLLGVGVLVALWSSLHFLSQTQDVWLRSHHLWVMRSCVGLLGLLVINSLFFIPLFWLPVMQGAGYYFMLAGILLMGLTWLWFLYRGIKGLRHFMHSKPVY